eukprot:scaffold18931_cov62-Attheya_sp.AAC.5
MTTYPFHVRLTWGELPWEQASGTDKDSEAGLRRSWVSEAEADTGTRQSRVPESEVVSRRYSKRTPLLSDHG